MEVIPTIGPAAMRRTLPRGTFATHFMWNDASKSLTQAARISGLAKQYGGGQVRIVGGKMVLRFDRQTRTAASNSLDPTFIGNTGLYVGGRQVQPRL